MSEKKGPFDTDFKGIIKNLSWPWYVWVIEELRQEYLCTDKDGKSICLLEKCEDYKSCVGKPFIQAIRILEVAGKVDKEGGLKFIHACGYPIFPYPKNARQIRALLKSLPEPEQKKE